MKKVFETLWAENAPILMMLKPLAWLYEACNRIHRFLYESGIFKQYIFSTPVIVVGNIFVGGTGKTPTVIALAEKYTQEGKKVGIISRGYGAKAAHYPIHVKAGHDPSIVGDEPLLIAESTSAMVVCDPNRVRGIRYLINAGCDLILSDDGLQHYRLKPSRSIAVHPADWQGSTDVLPAGPMREPLSRLAAFDEVIFMDDTKREYFCRDHQGNTVEFIYLPQDLLVMVGIAQPARLFAFLDKQGIRFTPHIFPDHYAFTQNDFSQISAPILMTTKDWVKCRHFAWRQPVYVIGYRVKI